MNLVFASGFLVPQHPPGINYFNGLKAHVEAQGHETVFPDVAPLASCEQRAIPLADQIFAKYPDGDIHIIAHSMGGLDSRVLIARNHRGLSGRIKSLTTISTPHAGTAVADLLLGRRPKDEGEFLASIADVLVPGLGAGGFLGRVGGIPGLPDAGLFGNIASVAGFLGLDLGALADLTTDGAKLLPDPSLAPMPFPIRYRSYAAVGRPPTDFHGILKQTCLLFVPFHNYLKKVTGEENDGLVPLSSSSHFGDFQQDDLWQCDHADAVGWNLDNPLSPAFLHLPRYDAIISKLEEWLTAAAEFSPWPRGWRAP